MKNKAVILGGMTNTSFDARIVNSKKTSSKHLVVQIYQLTDISHTFAFEVFDISKQNLEDLGNHFLNLSKKLKF